MAVAVHENAAIETRRLKVRCLALEELAQQKRLFAQLGGARIVRKQIP
jgi:hypothetical protein